jgi:hypothetical protein
MLFVKIDDLLCLFVETFAYLVMPAKAGIQS